MKGIIMTIVIIVIVKGAKLQNNNDNPDEYTINDEDS